MDAFEVKRVLLTGMSATGKSTLTSALAARGWRAVDLDSDAYSHWVASSDGGVEADRDWVWREDRVAVLLEEEGALFVSGCAANMGQFLRHFDHVVLLSAPPSVVLERLASRTTNTYGKDPEEAARVLGLIEEIEPRLRAVADLEIVTTALLTDVLERLESLMRA